MRERERAVHRYTTDHRSFVVRRRSIVALRRRATPRVFIFIIFIVWYCLRDANKEIA